MYPGGHDADAAPDGPLFPYFATNAYSAVTLGLSIVAAKLAVNA